MLMMSRVSATAALFAIRLFLCWVLLFYSAEIAIIKNISNNLTASKEIILSPCLINDNGNGIGEIQAAVVWPHG